MALGAGPKAFQNLQLAEAALGKTPTAEAPQLAAAAGAPEPVASAPAVAPSVVAPDVAKPNMALLSDADHAPAAASAARQEPQQLSALPSPSAREIAGRMELIKIAGNVYELKARVAAEPAAAPVISAAPNMAAAIEPKPAVQAVPQADKVRMARLEVSNGNGVTGMARRFRGLLGQMGIPVERLSNSKPYNQATTTIQYSPGFEKQAASLQKALQGKAQLASKQLVASDVRLVLGKDAQVSMAAVSEAISASQVALHGEN